MIIIKIITIIIIIIKIIIVIIIITIIIVNLQSDLLAGAWSSVAAFEWAHFVVFEAIGWDEMTFLVGLLAALEMEWGLTPRGCRRQTLSSPHCGNR